MIVQKFSPVEKYDNKESFTQHFSFEGDPLADQVYQYDGSNVGGDYLIAGQNLYKIDNNSITFIQTIPDTVINPTGAGHCALDPNGKFIIAAFDSYTTPTDPYYNLYNHLYPIEQGVLGTPIPIGGDSRDKPLLGYVIPGISTLDNIYFLDCPQKIIYKLAKATLSSGSNYYTITQVTTLSNIGSSYTIESVSFSSDGTAFLITTTASTGKYMFLYRRNGTSFTYVRQLSYAPGAANLNKGIISPPGNIIIALGTATSSYPYYVSSYDSNGLNQYSCYDLSIGDGQRAVNGCFFDGEYTFAIYEQGQGGSGIEFYGRSNILARYARENFVSIPDSDREFYWTPLISTNFRFNPDNSICHVIDKNGTDTGNCKLILGYQREFNLPTNNYTYFLDSGAYLLSGNIIVNGNSKEVALCILGGDSTTKWIEISYDGYQWSDTGASLDSNFTAFGYGGGKFVALSTDSARYSTDNARFGQIGRVSGFPSNYKWRSIAYGNGKFVAVGATGKYVAYSTNGIDWSVNQNLPYSADWRSVTYGAGKFWAVGQYRYGAFSSDGITWTSMTMPNTGNNWENIRITPWEITKGTYALYAFNGAATYAYVEVTNSSTSVSWTTKTPSISSPINIAFSTSGTASHNTLMVSSNSTGKVQYNDIAVDAPKGNIKNVIYSNNHFVMQGAGKESGSDRVFLFGNTSNVLNYYSFSYDETIYRYQGLQLVSKLYQSYNTDALTGWTFVNDNAIRYTPQSSAEQTMINNAEKITVQSLPLVGTNSVMAVTYDNDYVNSSGIKCLTINYQGIRDDWLDFIHVNDLKITCFWNNPTI